MIEASDCPFCDPKVIAQQTFHKTKNFQCFYNHKPVLPGHSLVVPKRHTESLLDLTDKELKDLAKLMREMSAVLMEAYGGTGIDLAIQDGFVAGASIAHTHLHIVPRKAGDIDGDPSLWFAKILEAEHAPKALSPQETKENIQKIKSVIKSRKQAERQKKTEQKVKGKAEPAAANETNGQAPNAANAEDSAIIGG